MIYIYIYKRAFTYPQRKKSRRVRPGNLGEATPQSKNPETPHPVTDERENHNNMEHNFAESKLVSDVLD